MVRDGCANCGTVGCRVNEGRCRWISTDQFEVEFTDLRASDTFAWAHLVQLRRRAASPLGLPNNHTFPMASTYGIPIGELKATGRQVGGTVLLHRLYYGQPDRPRDVVSLMIGTKKAGRGPQRIVQNYHIRQAVDRFHAWKKKCGRPNR